MLDAPDQLRQRVAWALSQIIVVGQPDDERQTEVYLNFYDIFVRHAFGNYKDVLKEAAASPVMGEYLTFLKSKSFAFDGSLPDENFAREIMQLFTIGLWRLNADGTKATDPATGANVPTYSNDDVASFARVWTGFDTQQVRGNVEFAQVARAPTNRMDPMQLKPQVCTNPTLRP